MRNTILTLTLGVMTLLGAGCDVGHGGGGEVEEVGASFAQAADRHDAEELAALFPTREQLAEALDCPSGAGPWKQVKKELANLALAAEVLAGGRLEFLGVDPAPGAQTTVAAGGALGKCTALTEVTTLETRFRLRVEKDGDTAEVWLGVSLMRLGGAGWVVVDL